MRVNRRDLTIEFPKLKPDRVGTTGRRLDIKPTGDVRLQASASRSVLPTSPLGGPRFWLALISPPYGLAFGEVIDPMLSGDRVRPGISTAGLVFRECWFNSEWHLGEVFTMRCGRCG